MRRALSSDQSFTSGNSFNSACRSVKDIQGCVDGVMVPSIELANVCALSIAVESNNSRVCRSPGESRRVMLERCGMTRSAISCCRSAYCRYSALSSCQRLSRETTLVAIMQSPKLQLLHRLLRVDPAWLCDIDGGHACDRR